MSDAYKNCLLLFKIYVYNKRFVYVGTRIRTDGKNYIRGDKKIICGLYNSFNILSRTDRLVALL